MFFEGFGGLFWKSDQKCAPSASGFESLINLKHKLPNRKNVKFIQTVNKIVSLKI